MLTGAHIFIFWYVPLKGNFDLYDEKDAPMCNEKDKTKYRYGCRNFETNEYLVKTYILICFYLYYSTIQIRHGLPTYKIPSSVTRVNDDFRFTLGCQIYMAVPFAAELRCLIDFCLTKTSLDIF